MSALVKKVKSFFSKSDSSKELLLKELLKNKEFLVDAISKREKEKKKVAEVCSAKKERLEKYEKEESILPGGLVNVFDKEIKKCNLMLKKLCTLEKHFTECDFDGIDSFLSISSKIINEMMYEFKCYININSKITSIINSKLNLN
jgi:hypothetical protein